MIDEGMYTPFRFREIGKELMITNEVGDFDFFKKDVINRFFDEKLTVEEESKFQNLSIKLNEESKWRLYSLVKRAKIKPISGQRKINYLIVIPTLRCDLSCTYCQVSSASLTAGGYDWDEQHLIQFANFLKNLDLDYVKVEFQGGEPTVRIDLIKKIIKICEEHSKSCDFVICSNITNLSNEFKSLIERQDIQISTSIDGPIATMTKNRTFDDALSKRIFDNFKWIIKTHGPEKISALPTVTEQQINDPESLIDCYYELGFESIFLRPVNYMGFARKQHTEISQQIDDWNKFYIRALEYIKEINKKRYMEEFYTATIVRSIFSKEISGFVNYRSPSGYLNDYCVIDFDGQIYPEDEARMLSRIKHVDLSVGNLADGFDEEKIKQLNQSAISQVNQDCIHCAYMPFCGIDIIDDMSRYRRFDVIKKDTWFCNRQTFIFDFLFSKVATQDRSWMDIFLRWIARSTDSSDAYELLQ